MGGLHTAILILINHWLRGDMSDRDGAEGGVAAGFMAGLAAAWQKRA
jgi:hypothetical protein